MNGATLLIERFPGETRAAQYAADDGRPVLAEGGDDGVESTALETLLDQEGDELNGELPEDLYPLFQADTYLSWRHISFATWGAKRP